MPRGGHTQPIAIVGDTAEWKKAQKNAKKKQASLIINSIIPIRNPR